MNFKKHKIKKIHFIGLGGIGVSALAKFFKLQGKEVSGSDLVFSETIEECQHLGIRFFKGHHKESLSSEIDLVVYSDAIPENNPEREEAKKRGIPQISYAEMLGELSKTKRTIAISGTNGKSTTTAMIGLILESAGFDPTVIVGSKVKTFPYGNLRLGEGEWLVVEGDEYRDHMLYLKPEIIVLTNLEEDHLDYFKDLQAIIKSFEKYLSFLPTGGYLIYNQDDVGCQKLLEQFFLKPYSGIKIVSYALENKADYLGKKLSFEAGLTQFEVKEKLSSSLFAYQLKIPGRFNVYNALAAIACTRTLGIKHRIIQDTLSRFSGIWRRFERIGKYQGALIISDYGHHPTAIKETLNGARAFYPNQRIVLVFQPHHRNRTKKLFNDFVKTLSLADLTIISEIYDVAGRELKEDESISSKDLVKAINKNNVLYGGNLDETKKIIIEKIKENDIVLIMGAGDIDKIARELINNR
jgi:UDP-N-acetylmuramate--alanine ligase